MPRKKVNTASAAPTQGRRTRRQAAQQQQLELQANEAIPSPDETDSSGPIITESTGTSEQEFVEIIPIPLSNIEETSNGDKSTEQMVVDTAEEVGVPEIPPPPIVDPKSEETTVESMDIAVESESVAVPQSETDPKLVHEIETAIEKITIESEPVEDVQQHGNAEAAVDVCQSTPIPTVSAPEAREEVQSHDENVQLDYSNTLILPSSADPPVQDSKEEDVPVPVSSSALATAVEYIPEDDELSIRRSSRIKTITKTKQKSRGHGLVVKERDSLIAPVASLSDPVPMPVTPTPVPVSAPPVDEQKPQKIKSRWLDSAKRDSLDLGQSLSAVLPMDSSSSLPVNTIAEPQPPPPPPEAESSIPTETPTAIDYYAPDPEVIECLKQLEQIKDNMYNCERNVSKEAKKMTCDCFLTESEKVAGEYGCGEDCLNRLLMIECGSRCVVGDRCTNRRFQTHQYAPVVVFKTEMKGFGLRAASEIEAGEFIMEYVGEVLNAKQFDKRANAYSKIKNKHYYFMALRSDAVIDATAKGNISRFINHSCDPNAETQKWTVNGELRIGFFTTRSIGAGEEVTFDYQYQRYGKEAQKCYCDAANCRGWIGEEPSDSEEEEDEDEEGDEDEEEVDEEEEEEESGAEGGDADEGEKTGKGPKKGGKKKGQKAGTKKGKAVQKKVTAKTRQKKVTATQTAPKPPRKPRKTARSRRQEILDDLDLDAEIDALARTGLKNQAHTLKLNRMMVRAKLPKTRLRLLALIQGADGPCRRLFLDYHGLRLLHGWMTDAVNQKDSELKMDLVRTLQLLPIPNKTMLKESHVLSSVANYGGLKLDSEKKEIVSEEGPLVPKFKKKKKLKKAKEEVSTTEESTGTAEVKAEDSTREDVPVKMEVDDGANPAETAAEEASISEEDQAEIERVNLENKMRVLCKEMVLKWVQLPEVFRIPKKERIEQMKEHEREADMRFTLLNDQEQEKKPEEESRFKTKGEDIKWVKREFKVPTNDGMSKSQRRHLFAMQVEEQKRNQQRMDAWQHHEFRCNFFGLDPFRVRPEDVPSWVDLENRSWFTYDLTEVPTPPNYTQVTMKAPEKEHAKMEDYDIPQFDLPEGWEYAMDPKGRLYYFHKKIRIPQWEVPIRLLPLDQTSSGDSLGARGLGRVGNGQGINGHGRSGGRGTLDSDAEEDGDRNEDSSTTDTCDSSEDEMVRRINRIKKLHKIGVPHSTIVKLNLHERNSDDEVTKEEVTKAEEEKAAANLNVQTNSSLGQTKRLLNRESLVEYREISPRRDEDRLYGQSEMKRYKETKEKFKQRKEMLKRRKLDKMMRAGLIGNDPDKRVSLRSIQITDDELYDETDEEQEMETGNGSLNGAGDSFAVDIQATTTVPLMEKIVLGNSRVDELDEPHKYNELTRLKIRERNAKRNKALKVQMKLKKMKMDEEFMEGGGIGFGEGNAAVVSGLTNNHHSTEAVVMSPVTGIQVANGAMYGTPLGASGAGGVGGPSSAQISTEKAKRIKDKFRSNIAGVIVQHLSPYRRDSCPIGRITNNEDFKHLAKKLTHFVLVKELKHCATVADLSVSESVKIKSKEFIRKYMSKYGKVYEKPDNEHEY